MSCNLPHCLPSSSPNILHFMSNISIVLQFTKPLFSSIIINSPSPMGRETKFYIHMKLQVKLFSANCEVFHSGVCLRVTFFWDVKLSHLIIGFRRFERASRLYLVGLLGTTGENTTLLRNVENQLANEAASHPRRTKSSNYSILYFNLCVFR